MIVCRLTVCGDASRGAIGSLLVFTEFATMGTTEPMILSPEELAKYDGSDKSLPLLICVKGIIFDVSPGRDFYGPGETLTSHE